LSDTRDPGDKRLFVSNKLVGFILFILACILIADTAIIAFQNIQPVETRCSLTSDKMITKVDNHTPKTVVALVFNIKVSPEMWVNSRFLESNKHIEPGRTRYYSFTFPGVDFSDSSLSKCQVFEVDFSDGTKWQRQSIIWP